MTTFTTEDRESASIKQQWELAYEDWEKLLETANALDLKDDPKAVWDEAWRQVSMIAYRIVDDCVKDVPLRKEIQDKIKKRLFS
jgi:hypothetical protein